MAWKGGNEQALNQLLPLVYGELRSLARNCLRRERSDHTLQPTALVHELFIRRATDGVTDWKDRAHFFGIAARAMRQILVAHARRHGALKRGGRGADPTAGLEQVIRFVDQLPGDRAHPSRVTALSTLRARLASGSAGPTSSASARAAGSASR